MSEGEEITDNELKQNAIAAFGITDGNIFEIVDRAKDFAIYKGMAMRIPALTYDTRVPLPFCLLPSPFPEKWFVLVKNMQQIMNYVLHKIAHSKDFLYNCLENTIKIDDFTAQIWKIYETVQSEGQAQPVSLGLLRCDYMLDTDASGHVTGIKQVESNTFASSFSGVAQGVLDLHRFVLDRLGMHDKISKLPENSAFYDMAKGIVTAWDIYGKESAAVLFVVEDVTYNICDQRALEFAICEIERSIQVLRYTFKELIESSVLEDGCLFADGKEIAVVYYRYGYSPDHYDHKVWEFRLLAEKSRAIKCPTIGYHLAGTKRVQLQLTHPGVLEKFLPEGVDPDGVKQVFAQQYSLDMGRSGDEAVALGIKDPHSYVMKPEREGGGNNIYGEEVRTLLQSIGSSDSRMAYILMEKISPPHIRNYIIRHGVVPKASNIISEIGIYGVILGTKDRVMKSYQAGHIVRSKEVGVNEGGIAAGFGALDSPYLI